MSFLSDNPFAVIAVLLAATAIAALGEQTALGKRLSGAMIAIIVSIAFANIGLLPRQSPVYTVIWSYFVPLAIALYLIKADMRRILSEGGRVLVGFLFGAAGVVVGTVVASVLLDVGELTAEYAAVFSATYIGGSMNFAAVSEAIGFKAETELAAALAIDNVLGLGYFILLGSVVAWPITKANFGWRLDQLNEKTAIGDGPKKTVLELVDVTLSLTIAAGACAVGFAIAAAAGTPTFAILFVTAIMLTVATIARSRLATLNSDEVLGTVLIYLFLATIGAGADLVSMLQAAPALFAFVLIILLMHIVFIVLAGMIFKLNYAELAIASFACIGGPPVAAAFAILFGWRQLAAPGVLTGVFGYAAGNFIGVSLFHLMQS